jgi:hypothetical protein
MPRFLHVADLHFDPEEYDYSEAVLTEIEGVAEAHRVDAVLVAGHLGEVPRKPAGAPWLLAPAAEEVADVAGIHPLEPLAVTPHAGVEIVALPTGTELAPFHGWDLPAKQTRWRIAVAHAPALAMASPRHDARATILDPALLDFWEVDYGALGSAHDIRAPAHCGNALMADPGAARVTGAHEYGPRGGFLINLEEELQVRWQAFAAAGCVREAVVQVAPDGSFDLDTAAWHPHDLVSLSLRGLLRTSARDVEDDVRQRFGAGARRVDINTCGLNRAGARTAALGEQVRRTTTPAPVQQLLLQTLLETEG